MGGNSTGAGFQSSRIGCKSFVNCGIQGSDRVNTALRKAAFGRNVGKSGSGAISGFGGIGYPLWFVRVVRLDVFLPNADATLGHVYKLTRMSLDVPPAAGT